MKLAALAWLVVLAAIHLWREAVLLRNYSEAMYVLWGLSGFLVPLLFTLAKSPIPLLGGNSVLTLYELRLSYGALFSGEQVSGEWWVIEPIFLTLLFAVPATILWFWTSARETSSE